jgi:hypothetical protein
LPILRLLLVVGHGGIDLPLLLQFEEEDDDDKDEFAQQR